MTTLRRAIAAPANVVRGLDDFEVVFYAGQILLAVGLVSVWPPLALIVPGLVISGVAFILRIRRP